MVRSFDCYHLVSTAYSGSEIIQGALDAQREISCCRIGRQLPEPLSETPDSMLSRALGQMEKRCKGIALRIAGDSCSWSDTYWENISSANQKPTIYVFRRNRLQQALMKVVGSRGSLWDTAGTSMDGGGGETTASFARQRCDVVIFPAIDCEQLHDEIVQAEAREIAFFALHRLVWICPVAIEDFISNCEVECQRISDFLGVPCTPCQSSRHDLPFGAITKVISNFPEVRDYFQQSPFAHWCNNVG